MLYAQSLRGRGTSTAWAGRRSCSCSRTATTASRSTVHLVHCGEGDLLANRKQAVELYLKTADGPNTLTFHPAAAGMVRFAKTESGKVDASETTTDTSAMGGGSASSPK